MRIFVEFHFNHEELPAATTGVEGDVSTILLPGVGDLVRHTDSGKPFLGKVTDRIFDYRITEGKDVDGAVRVILSLDRVIVQ